LFRRDKLYFIIKSKYDVKAPSKKQVDEWLSKQEINQIFRPSKGKTKDIKTNITTPNTILANDLMNMEKFQVRPQNKILKLNKFVISKL
jgi:hypothetical protein